MLENELSFLAKSLPDLSRLDRKEIEQHYLSDENDPLRLRKIGDSFELTKKLSVSEEDMSRKEELTIPLSAKEFQALRGLSVRSLTKTRYFAPLPDGLTAEIDVFTGPLEGLVMIEVEFPDEEKRRQFLPPPWFGRDVSQEEWSTNSFLAGKKFEVIKGFLK